MSLVELQRLQSKAGHMSFIYFFNFPPFFSRKKEPPPTNVGGSETVMFENKNLKMMHNELGGG